MDAETAGTGTDTGVSHAQAASMQMHPAMRAYLVLGIATLAACAIMAAQAVLIAPSSGYKVLVLTNIFGEGGFEAALVVAMIPSWAILLRRLIAHL